MNNIYLPTLTSIESCHVHQLTIRLAAMIKNLGPIPFSSFMKEVLYGAQLGYYISNKEKFGVMGDFLTAPMSSVLFGQTFALQFSTILSNLPDNAVIIEFGAGNGKFAFDCLQKLKSLNSLPSAYYIIELSSSLKYQQQILLKKLGEFYKNIYWLDKLPEKKFNAIVFANEVLDAMPVEIVSSSSNGPKRMMVNYHDNQFIWEDQEVSINSQLNQALNTLSLQKVLCLKNYQTEVNLWIKPWLKSIRNILNSGVVFICDYGYHRDLYYSQERFRGTLQCYYRHYVHDNPLIYPGVQDITAHVDFTSVAEISTSLGFTLDGFAIQSDFLSTAGIFQMYDQLMLKLNNGKEKFSLNQQVKLLTSLSNELTGNFKVMSISFKYDQIIDAFNEIDMSHLL